MKKDNRITLTNRLTRNGVPRSMSIALAWSGVLSYDESRKHTGEGIKKNALETWNACIKKATVKKEKSGYVLSWNDGFSVFSSLVELRQFAWFDKSGEDANRVLKGEEVQTILK